MKTASRLIAPVFVLFVIGLTGSFTTDRGAPDDPRDGPACATHMQREDRVTGDYLDVVPAFDGRFPIVFHIFRNDSGGEGFEPLDGMTVEESCEYFVRHLNDMQSFSILPENLSSIYVHGRFYAPGPGPDH